MSVSPATRLEFIEALWRHTTQPVDVCSEIGRLLMRHGATYKGLQETFCDGVDEDTERVLLARGKRLEQRVTALCGLLGVTPVFSGDPRGATIKLKMPDGYTNDWGKTGLCVPTS